MYKRIIEYMLKKNHIDAANSVGYEIYDDIDGFEILRWDLPVAEPTKEELDAIAVEADMYYRSLEYKTYRDAKYPPIEEQLDMLYWDQVNGTNEWRTMIRDIKETYPKPEEL